MKRTLSIVALLTTAALLTGCSDDSPSNDCDPRFVEDCFCTLDDDGITNVTGDCFNGLASNGNACTCEVGEPPLEPDFECFTAGTPIQTPNGTKPIESLKLGDMVMAFDEKTGAIGPQPVVHLFERKVGGLVVLGLPDEAIQTTTKHPFWVVGTGWTEAGGLKQGDVLRSWENHLVQIESVEQKRVPSTVYNLTVGGWHTYMVGNSAAVVHNKSPDVNPDVNPEPIDFRFVMVQDEVARPNGDFPGSDIDAIGLIKNDGFEVFATDLEADTDVDCTGNLACDTNALLGTPDAIDPTSAQCFDGGAPDGSLFTALNGGRVVVSFGNERLENGDAIHVYELGAAECGRFDDDPFSVQVSATDDFTGDVVDLGQAGNGDNIIDISGLP